MTTAKQVKRTRKPVEVTLNVEGVPSRWPDGELINGITGACHFCDTRVSRGAGIVVMTRGGRRTVGHREGECRKRRPQPTRIPYEHWDGLVAHWLTGDVRAQHRAAQDRVNRDRFPGRISSARAEGEQHDALPEELERARVVTAVVSAVVSLGRQVARTREVPFKPAEFFEALTPIPDTWAAVEEVRKHFPAGLPTTPSHDDL